MLARPWNEARGFALETNLTICLRPRYAWRQEGGDMREPTLEEILVQLRECLRDGEALMDEIKDFTGSKIVTPELIQALDESNAKARALIAFLETCRKGPGDRGKILANPFEMLRTDHRRDRGVAIFRRDSNPSE